MVDYMDAVPSGDDLTSAEVQDASLRWHEGGGNMPLGFYEGGGLAAMGVEGDPWYKKPEFLLPIGIGAVGLLLICLLTKKN